MGRSLKICSAVHSEAVQVSAVLQRWLGSDEPIDGRRHRLHLCGAENPNCPCMENGRWTQNYPKEFKKKTSVDPDNYYATYRRRAPEDGGRQLVCPKSGRIIDNRWIVPYNPYLLLRYESHINVECCTSTKVAKYLYKYVTKGNFRAMVNASVDNGNEIDN